MAAAAVPSTRTTRSSAPLARWSAISIGPVITPSLYHLPADDPYATAISPMHRRGDRGGRTTCLQACTPSKPSLELKPNSTRRSGTLVEAPAVVSLTGDAAMIALERILIPTDFSEPSDVGLTYGLELARAFRATAIVIHVGKDRFARVLGDGIVVSTPELQTDHENSARRRLDVLLHKHSEVSTTVQVDCFREQSYVDEQPMADGSLIMHCGGFYRIRAHAI